MTMFQLRKRSVEIQTGKRSMMLIKFFVMAVLSFQRICEFGSSILKRRGQTQLTLLSRHLQRIEDVGQSTNQIST